MMPIQLLALATALILTAQSAMAAGLAWEKALIEENAAFGQKKVIVSFGFDNQGDHPIAITGTQTSCGCTVANLDKTVYQPGESGAVAVTFDIGQRSGKQTKRIKVSTDEAGSDGQYELVLTVDIPQAIALTPRVLTWKRNEQATAKEISVILHEQYPLSIESLLAQNDDANNFAYEIIETKKKNAYTIRITPKDMSSASRARFLLGSDADDAGILAKHLIYAFLR